MFVYWFITLDSIYWLLDTKKILNSTFILPSSPISWWYYYFCIIKLCNIFYSCCSCTYFSALLRFNYYVALCKFKVRMLISICMYCKMVMTLRLVNTSIPSQSSHFVFVVRRLITFSLHSIYHNCLASILYLNKLCCKNQNKRKYQTR